MGLWQLILISLVAFSLGVHGARHGESRADENYNFWYKVADSAILLTILYFGGFFGG